MASSAAVTVAALLVLGALLLDLPIQAWKTKTRYVVLGVMVLSLIVTMSAATELVLNAGPLQIWPLDPFVDTL